MPMVRTGLECRARVWHVLTDAPEETRCEMYVPRSAWKSMTPLSVSGSIPAAIRSIASISAVRFSHPLEDRPSRGFEGHPGGKLIGQGMRERLEGFPAVLGVAGKNPHGWRVRVEVEPLGCQGPQFLPSESGPGRQGVQHGAVRAGYPLDERVGRGCFHQPGGFLGS